MQYWTDFFSFRILAGSPALETIRTFMPETTVNTNSDLLFLHKRYPVSPAGCNESGTHGYPKSKASSGSSLQDWIFTAYPGHAGFSLTQSENTGPKIIIGRNGI
jgi:hypothetical protein